MSKSIWYKKELNKYLSQHGFKHFLTKEPMTEDFKVGVAYMIDIENKTFGIKDMIPYKDCENATLLAEEFESTGKLMMVEGELQDAC